VAPSQFVLTAERARADERDSSDGEATLHLPRQGQIVQRESSRALLGAVLGLPLQAREFVSALTGCAHPGGNVSARMSGSNAMRVSVGNAFPVEHLLQRKGQQVSWTLAAIGRESPGRGFRWRAEYQRDSGEVLRSIRIVSEESNRASDRLFDLHFSLSQVQFAPLIVAETFSPRVPAGTRAVSLQAVQSARSRLPMVNGSR
jgi:hypothetical protein